MAKLDPNGQQLELITEDDLERMRALIASPVYGSLVRLIRREISLRMTALLDSRGQDSDVLKGEIRGLRLLENIPVISADLSDRLRKKREEKAEAEKKKASIRSPRSETGKV